MSCSRISYLASYFQDWVSSKSSLIHFLTVILWALNFHGYFWKDWDFRWLNDSFSFFSLNLKSSFAANAMSTFFYCPIMSKNLFGEQCWKFSAFGTEEFWIGFISLQTSMVAKLPNCQRFWSLFVRCMWVFRGWLFYFWLKVWKRSLMKCW